jgi:hypothetical protein
VPRVLAGQRFEQRGDGPVRSLDEEERTPKREERRKKGKGRTTTNLVGH